MKYIIGCLMALLAMKPLLNSSQTLSTEAGSRAQISPPLRWGRQLPLGPLLSVGKDTQQRGITAWSEHGKQPAVAGCLERPLLDPHSPKERTVTPALPRHSLGGADRVLGWHQADLGVSSGLPCPRPYRRSMILTCMEVQ